MSQFRVCAHPYQGQQGLAWIMPESFVWFLHLFKVTSAFMEGKGTLTGTHSAGSGLREKQIQVYLS